MKKDAEAFPMNLERNYVLVLVNLTLMKPGATLSGILLSLSGIDAHLLN
jgi:hypothetical protein